MSDSMQGRSWRWGVGWLLRKKGTFRRAPESFFQSLSTQKAFGQRAHDKVGQLSGRAVRKGWGPADGGLQRKRRGLSSLVYHCGSRMDTSAHGRHY